MAENGFDFTNFQNTLIDMQASGDVKATSKDVSDRQSPNGFQGRPGSQLDGKQIFRDKKGQAVGAYPIIVDFRRMMQLGTTESVIKGISNQDLLHAVVALYDVSLSEMTPDVLYSTVCDKWARTILLVRDLKETKEHTTSRKLSENEDKDKDVDTSGVINEELDTYEGEDATPSVFADVFSDEEDDEEEEDDSEEEDFSKGIGTFLKGVSERRKQDKVEDDSHVGIERRLMGCATFEKKFVHHKDRVVHLTLVSVRPKYRGFGLGKYLLSQVVDPVVAGSYEAVVVHADNSAVEFFQKFGFSDDIVLNSRWSELAEQFTNCTLMCYLPGFTGVALLNTSRAAGADVIDMEHDFNKWKDKTLEAYQAQISVVMRMKHEILHLKHIVKSQSDMLTKLAIDNEHLRKEKTTVEKEFLSYRLSMASATFDSKDLPIHDVDDDEEDIPTDDLIRSLQQQVDMMDAKLQNRGLHTITDTADRNKVTSIGDSSYIAFPSARVRSEVEAHDQSPETALFCDLSQQFEEGMRADHSIKVTYKVTAVSRALLPERVKSVYQRRQSLLVDGSMVTQLYYCGSLERSERIPNILNSGFAEADFAHGEYGRALYFSKYPSKAAQFSALGQLLLVEVGLGRVETVTKQDRTRRTCSDGFDSIITPGRLQKDDRDLEPTLCQEYVVFDVSQVLPLYLINYSSAD